MLDQAVGRGQANGRNLFHGRRFLDVHAVDAKLRFCLLELADGPLQRQFEFLGSHHSAVVSISLSSRVSGTCAAALSFGLAGAPVAQEALPFPEPQGPEAARTMELSTHEPRQVVDRLPPDAPNILIIMLDDVGPALPSTYGGVINTPTLSRVAEAGVSFNRFHNAAMCSPTRAALMSGQYGSRTGVYTVGGIDRFAWQTRPLRPVDNVVDLPLDKITIAQSLKSAGYATGMFGKWHIGQQGEYHPGRRGFDNRMEREHQDVRRARRMRRRWAILPDEWFCRQFLNRTR